MITRRQLGQMIGAGSIGAMLAKAPATFAQDGNVLRIATNTSDLANLDAHFATGTQDRTVADMVYNGLIRFVPGTVDQFEPDLAEDMPEVTDNDDGTQTWTFVLREGVMTHAVEGAESAELTVADVLFSYEKAANGDTSAFASNYLDWVFEADEETREFRITIPEPTSTSLFYPNVTNYSGGFIIPQAAYEALGADGMVTHPAGTGPFAFSNYEPQNNLELAAHADYFRGAPQLGGVQVVYLPDSTSRELALEAGDLEVIRGTLEKSWVDRINESENLTADVFGVGEVVWFNFNTEHEVLQDVRVREAIVKAISRENHVGVAGEPISMPIYSVIPEDFMPGGLTEEEAEEAGVNYQQDVEAALALLAEAGYEDGFELDLITSEQPDYRSNYEVLQEELRQIGITVNLEVVQHATMHELIREGRNAITIYIAYRPTPDMYLTAFFSSDGGVERFSRFDLDELRDQARQETDADAQAQIWKQANIEILQNYAAFGIMYTNQVYARKNTVDYGHELNALISLYPGITENTTMESEE